MTTENDTILEGSHDGIREFDNDLPRWWRVLFYLTIIGGAIYAADYHLIRHRSSTGELDAALNQIRPPVAQQAAATELDEGAMAKLVADPLRIAHGKEVFSAKCAACHGQEGQGLIGPNLTDDYWIHGGKLVEIRHTIEAGVLDKGMLSWKGLLPEEDILSAVAFIRSIHGTSPANPKAPQGELVKNP